MTGRRSSFGDTPEREARANGHGGNGHGGNGHVTSELLAAYADQELERGPALEVERHLGACTACQASVRLQRAVRDRLRQEADTTVPSALRDRVFAAVRAAPAPVAHGLRTPTRARRRPAALIAAFAWRPAWAAAAVLAAAALGLWAWRPWVDRGTPVADGAARARGDSAAIVHLIQDHAAAWNSRNPDAVAALLTADAVWVTSGGTELHGRQAIRDAHVQWLAQDAALGSTTHVHPEDGIRVRFVRDDVAVVDLVGQFIRASVAGGQPTVVEQARIFVVATKVGDAWRISHLRNLSREGARPTPR
jgi:uncharacterized protein (TIGR02246 family)